MADHLTALDATFLELEEADDSVHMHIGAIMVFDPLPGGGAPTREQLAVHLAHRLGQLPRYGQRLSSPHVGSMSWPSWEDDRDFDLKRHVAHAALPAPGGELELAEWSSQFFSQRLDRRRPLWEITLLEGLSEGRWALASKTHHCMVDGVGSVDVTYLLLDASADAYASSESYATDSALASEFPDAGRRITRADSRASQSAGGLPGLSGILHGIEGLAPLGAAAQAAQMAWHGTLHPREALAEARAAVRMLIAEELHGAPHTSLNDPIGSRRRFEVVRVDLDEMKEIKDALGGTVNDVALALSALGLRALLGARGEPLPTPGIRAMVPMNVRAASERLALGNRISSLFLDLPVAEPDPLELYLEIAARTRALKSDGEQAAGTATVLELAGLAPPAIHSAIARSLYATRLFNLTITNVPGPQQTLYAFGAPLREVHPLVPLAASHAVGVAIVSYDGSAFFGVVADHDTVSDLDVMTQAMRSAVGELLGAARGGRARTDPMPPRRAGTT